MLEDGRSDRIAELVTASRQAGIDEAWQLRLLVLAADLDRQRTGVLPAGFNDQTLVELLQRHPYNIQDHLMVADLYWVTGNRTEAVDLYRRLLELDVLGYLEPDRQLTPDQRRHIDRRIGQESERGAAATGSGRSKEAGRPAPG